MDNRNSNTSVISNVAASQISKLTITTWGKWNWYKLWAQIFRFTQVKLMIDPPFETARAQSELFTVQCHQWEPIQNSQLIRKYKEMSVLPR